MKSPQADAGYRRVLLAPKAALKVRLEALSKMSSPSVRLLTRIVRDPGTHAKLRLMAANRLSEVQREREINKILKSETDRLKINGQN